MDIDVGLIKGFMIVLIVLGGLLVVVLGYSFLMLVIEVSVEKLRLFEGFRKEFRDYRKNKKDYKMWKKRY